MRRLWCLRWSAATSVLRASHLNWALVANEKNATKAECLGLMSVYLARFCVLNFWALVCGNCDSPFSSLPFQKLIHLLKVSSVTLSFQRSFGVLLVRFLRRCFFQVVSVTSALKLRLI